MENRFTLIKVKYPKKVRNRFKWISSMLLLPISFLFATFWLPAFFISLISMIIVIIIVNNKLNNFDKVGDIECLTDKLVINSKNVNKEIYIKDIKGIKINTELYHPMTSGTHQEFYNNAFNIIIKCTISESYEFTVFNYLNHEKRMNSRLNNSFTKKLKEYSKKYHLKFWDKTGLKSHII